MTNEAKKFIDSLVETKVYIRSKPELLEGENEEIFDAFISCYIAGLQMNEPEVHPMYRVEVTPAVNPEGW